MGDEGRRPPRWDPDERGIGVADARAQLEVLDALRRAADETGWVAEDPEAHLGPHLDRAASAGVPWIIDATATAPDGTFEVDLRWTGSADADRRAVRVAAYGLIAVIAEGATAIHERRGPAGGVEFDVVTGELPGETRFASHGHTVRLRIGGMPSADRAASTDG